MRVSTRNLTFISRSRLSEVLHYPSVLSRTPGTALCIPGGNHRKNDGKVRTGTRQQKHDEKLIALPDWRCLFGFL